MKACPNTFLLIAILGVAPVTRVSADKYDRKHHLTDTEKVVAGIVIVGLAVAAANDVKHEEHRKQVHKEMVREERQEVHRKNRNKARYEANHTVSVTIYKHKRPKVIYLTGVKSGGFLGPRGEHYPTLPSERRLESVYGD
jgi:hypothetical protein